MMIHCDRCDKDVDGSVDPDGGMSAGVYCVGEGKAWHNFANPGERVVCDDCMWADPRYMAIYGDMRSTMRIAERKPIPAND